MIHVLVALMCGIFLGIQIADCPEGRVMHDYIYDAKVLNIVDGDTVDVLIFLGLDVSVTERLRLHRINAWETRGAEREKGLLAKDFVAQVLTLGDVIEVHTYKDKKGKYGRYLADIYCGNGEHRFCLNDELVARGHARYQEY